MTSNNFLLDSILQKTARLGYFLLTVILAVSIMQAVLKIIKHCEEFAPALVTGQLLGLDVGSVLEVTNCFPFPVSLSFFVVVYVFYCDKITSRICVVYPFYRLMATLNFTADQRR